MKLLEQKSELWQFHVPYTVAVFSGFLIKESTLTFTMNNYVSMFKFLTENTTEMIEIF